LLINKCFNEPQTSGNNRLLTDSKVLWQSADVCPNQPLLY
jgi:hypothetical protein